MKRDTFRSADAKSQRSLVMVAFYNHSIQTDTSALRAGPLVVPLEFRDGIMGVRMYDLVHMGGINRIIQGDAGWKYGRRTLCFEGYRRPSLLLVSLEYSV